MSGALVELVATGVQDTYLTGDPQVSFFRQKYSRHTNFAFKPVELLPMGTIAPNSEITIKIPNKGDILSGIWMDWGNTIDKNDFGNLGSNTNSPTIFELYIGGQLIDRQDSTFTEFIWPLYLAESVSKSILNSGSKISPLHFFFCDNHGLPLVALQYHEVEIKIKFSNVDPSGVKFYAEYIMLDTNERNWFVNSDHNLLIEQLQRIPPTVTGSNPVWDLSLLNHPVKSLHTSNNLVHTNGTAMIYLNGSELFDTPMPFTFFDTVQPYYHTDNYNGLLLNGLNMKYNLSPQMYSFAMKANKNIPTGSCNFSRLDNAELKVTGTGLKTDDNKYLYAVNWNILRIKKGMAGLAFSN